MWVLSLGQEDSPEKGHGNPFQYSCLENPMNRGALGATVHRLAESDMTEASMQPTHSVCHFKSGIIMTLIS